MIMLSMLGKEKEKKQFVKVFAASNTVPFQSSDTSDDTRI